MGWTTSRVYRAEDQECRAGESCECQLEWTETCWGISKAGLYGVLDKCSYLLNGRIHWWIQDLKSLLVGDGSSTRWGLVGRSRSLWVSLQGSSYMKHFLTSLCFLSTMMWAALPHPFRMNWNLWTSAWKQILLPWSCSVSYSATARKGMNKVHTVNSQNREWVCLSRVLINAEMERKVHDVPRFHAGYVFMMQDAQNQTKCWSLYAWCFLIPRSITCHTCQPFLFSALVPLLHCYSCTVGAY